MRDIYMKVNILKLVYFFLMLIIVPNIYAQNLLLDIELDKKEFIEGEAICLLVNLTNLSSKIFNYDDFSLESGTLILNVTDDKGTTLPYFGLYIRGFKVIDSTNMIVNGKSVQYMCELSQTFPNYKETGLDFSFPIASRLLPGNYRVKAHYKNEEQILQSKELSFSVIAPQGEEAKLFEILKIKFHPDFIFKMDQDTKIKSFDDLVGNHPTSIYLPRLQRMLAGSLLKKGDVVRANDVLKKIIKIYPNSGYAMEAIQTMKLSIQEKEKFLNEIKLKNPHSRIVKYGENILKKDN